MNNVLYHIGDDGRLAKCRAKKRSCPKNSPHFSSQEEGQLYLDNLHEKEENKYNKKRFKQLTTNTVESELKNKKSKTSQILELSKRNQ